MLVIGFWPRHKFVPALAAGDSFEDACGQVFKLHAIILTNIDRLLDRFREEVGCATSTNSGEGALQASLGLLGAMSPDWTTL